MFKFFLKNEIRIFGGKGPPSSSLYPGVQISQTVKTEDTSDVTLLQPKKEEAVENLKKNPHSNGVCIDFSKIFLIYLNFSILLCFAN